MQIKKTHAQPLAAPAAASGAKTSPAARTQPPGASFADALKGAQASSQAPTAQPPAVAGA